MTIYINVIFCFTDQEYIELLTVWRKQGKKNYENNDSYFLKASYKLWCLIYNQGLSIKKQFHKSSSASIYIHTSTVMWSLWALVPVVFQVVFECWGYRNPLNLLLFGLGNLETGFIGLV